MTPYYDKGGITIWHADCRDVLPSLTAGPVDLVLTDPPYGINYTTARRSRYDPKRVPVTNDKSLDVIVAAWPLTLCCLAEDRHWYAFASPRMIAEAQPLFHPKQIIAWDKGNRGTVGDLECGFGEAWEAIFYGMKGRRPLNGKRPRSVIRFDWSSTDDPVHPTIKPVALLRTLVRLSANPGETVLDPFMGSGTTLRAAKDAGLKAVGIEIEERYCEIAARRLEQEVFAWGEAE